MVPPSLASASQKMEKELGPTLVAFTPLPRASAPGAIQSSPPSLPPEDNRSGRFQFSEEGFRYYQQALDLIRFAAEEKFATMAQVCLGWMIRKKP